jgi:NAD(P)-dependent dehydrogenase (short-subunit alcohol dehydrogenase family)
MDAFSSIQAMPVAWAGKRCWTRGRRAVTIFRMADTDPRVWLITGSSSGFGLQLARTALEHGDRVVATARDPEALAALALTQAALPVMRRQGSGAVVQISSMGGQVTMPGDSAAPLHLALGGDAVDAIRAAQDGRRADLEAWEQVSRRTAA